jgi:hypothetical protein
MAIILKPRITIYAFNDTTYATQLYTYNAFTDSGATTKPVSMQFESTTTGAGSFSIEIEDSDGLLDQETFIKGNRIFIECSKDGSTWQPAFKGLIRSVKRSLFGALGSTFTISGYSYLVRLNERILNTIRESTVTGGQYNRTDSTMFTNNLINSILTTDSNYVYGLDDTQQYSLFKTSNIASSPITTWIPRLDAQLVPISEAISSILEFSSNALMVMDPSNDQLVLFDPQQIASGANVFLVTDQPNFVADDAAITMYPIEPYTYDISYDYPDSGSRLIATIGLSSPVDQCPPDEVVPPVFNYEISFPMGRTMPSNLTSPCPGSGGSAAIHGMMTSFQSPLDGTLKGITIPVTSSGNLSGSHNSVLARIYAYTNGSSLGAQVGPDITLYKDGVAGTPFPSANSNLWFLKTAANWTSANLTVLTNYYLGVLDDISNNSVWFSLTALNSEYNVIIYSVNYNPPSWWGNGGNSPFGSIPVCLNAGNGFNTGGWFHIDLDTTAPRGACGGVPAVNDADPVFAVAEDKNMSKRLGMVERVVSDLPPHIRTKQTMDEYLFAKLFTASKPRFTFDFPAVSIPTKIPKAGDIVAHVAKKAGVGTKTSPLQTGVIMSVSYEFRQDDEGIIGLTKLGLSTTGIRRGYY